jgi:hypothetical protein
VRGQNARKSSAKVSKVINLASLSATKWMFVIYISGLKRMMEVDDQKLAAVVAGGCKQCKSGSTLTKDSIRHLEGKSFGQLGKLTMVISTTATTTS